MKLYLLLAAVILYAKWLLFKNCDTLISPKWAAGEPKLWNSGCTQ